MSHEVETMAYANQVPWHGLGARVDTDVSVEEMLEAAGLNWRVNLCPMTAETPDGDHIRVKDRYALVRDTDNRVLTITGKSWHPLQNEDTLGLMREYVSAGGATLETAGSLRGGRVVWGLAKLNHQFNVTRGDAVNGYLLITSPHEVGKAITVRTTTVRVVCANTMAMANSMSEINYKQNHLAAFDTEAAKGAIALAHDELAEAEKRAKMLHKLKLDLKDAMQKVFIPSTMPKTLEPEVGMTDEEHAEHTREILDRIIQPEEQPAQLQQLVESYNNAPGAEPGTGWGAMNAVTYWADHVVGRNSNSRMWRAWVGDTGRMKLDAERRLLELAA